MGTEQGYVECDRTESCFIIVCIIIMKISAFLRHKTIHAIVDRASCPKPAQEKLAERRKLSGISGARKARDIARPRFDEFLNPVEPLKTKP